MLFIGSDYCVLGRCDKGIWDITRLRWSELFGIVYRLNLLCNGITSRWLRKLLDFAKDIVIWSRWFWVKIGDLELSENLFCIDMQGCGRTQSRTHFNYFDELCVDLVQFMRWCDVVNFFFLWWMWGDWLPVLIFGRVVWVELIREYDNIMLIL